MNIVSQIFALSLLLVAVICNPENHLKELSSHDFYEVR